MVLGKMNRTAWRLGLSGLAGLMLSTAVWADDAVPDGGGLIAVDVVQGAPDTVPACDPCDAPDVVIDDGNALTGGDDPVADPGVTDGSDGASSGDGAADGTDDGTVVDDGDPGVIYTMDGGCINCDGVQVTGGGSVSAASNGPGSFGGGHSDEVAHAAASAKGASCQTSAISWLCEWTNRTSY